MGYFMREIITGAVREIEKWKKPTREAKRQAQRAAKLNESSEAQKKVNLENAERRLRWDINANFVPGDYWLTFTYAKEYTPSYESCEEDYKKLIRRIRVLYRRAGIELKYVSAYNEPERRPHIHILAKQGVPLREIQALWGYGHISIKLLDESRQYKRLAEYIIKHFKNKLGKKKWNASKNLIHPQPREREVSAKNWKDDIKPPKGWMIDKSIDVEKGVNPITGAEYIRYSLLKIPEIEKSGNKNARTRAGATTYA